MRSGDSIQPCALAAPGGVAGPRGRPLQRIAPERVLDVGQQQLLMLLFVVDAELDKRARRGREIGERGLNRRINMRAPDAHFVERRPRQQPALRARVARPLGLDNSCSKR